MARRVHLPILLSALAFLILLVFAGVGIWHAMGSESELAMEGENDRGYQPPTQIPTVLPAVSLDGIRAAILTLPINAAMTEAGAYDRETKLWRAWSRRVGATLVSDPATADVLIVPLAPCLGVPERQLIARHLERGGGLMTVGALGSHDGQCTPLADTLLATLLGGPPGSVAPFRPAGGSEHHVVVLGETLLGAFVPPGARLELHPGNQLVFRDTGRGVYYSDFYRNPVRHRGERFYDAVVARSRVGPGRVVALGFGLGEVVDGWSVAVAEQMAAAALLWAAGRPVAHLAPWPSGYQAAAVVAQDVEADYANADKALDLLDEVKIPSTFFVVGKLAEQNRFITRRMSRFGEIGSHTYDHRPLDQFTDAEQREGLGVAVQRTQRLSGQPVIGLRPPEERFTIGTLRSWAALGGRYVFAANNSRAAAPEIVPLEGDTLVLLARVVDDDFELLSRDSLRNRRVMVERLRDQLQDVIAYRGLFMFSYHSHMFAQESLLPVVEALALSLKATPGVWITEGRTVAQWWRDRAAVRTEVAADGRSVRVRNGGTNQLRRAVLLVEMPDGTQRRLALPDLPPGREVRIALDR